MGKFVDRTGQRFGKLTVIVRAPNAANGKPAWVVRCDCGVTKVSRAQALQSGRVNSCGCEAGPAALERAWERKAAIGAAQAQALVGQTVGLNEVLRVIARKRGELRRCVVRCAGCGSEREVLVDSLLHYGNESCAPCAAAAHHAALAERPDTSHPANAHPRHPTVSVNLARVRMRRGWSLKAACMIPKDAKTLPIAHRPDEDPFR